jgi:hypothetical protein
LNERQRKERLERLPIFKYVFNQQEYRLIREAFKHDRGAVLTYRSGQRDSLWTSAEDLFDAYVHGSVVAETKVRQLRESEENRQKLPGDRALALQGSTWHKIFYVHRSVDSYDDADHARALNLLETDTSATAVWFMEYFKPEPDLDFTTANGIVLWTRYLLEDLHRPDLPEVEAHAYDDDVKTWFCQFIERAEAADPAAVEGLNQLSTEYGIDLRLVIENWESIRSHHPES